MLRRKILVMDDEDLIRNVAGKMLEFLGYQAILARNGEEAVRAYQAELDAGSAFHAVLLDWNMAGSMDGPEALRRLRALDPGVRAILSSGYAEAEQRASMQAEGFAGVIAKPYVIKTLQDVLEALPG